MRGNHPTTGFLAVTLGLNYCDEVDVAGFGYPLNQKNGRIHYFDQLSMKHMATLNKCSTVSLGTAVSSELNVNSLGAFSAAQSVHNPVASAQAAIGLD
ncbi:hypothetical protein chiPu_0014163 [Chiloscyllium punctatum]|uniref:Uncharacterized protein n=1 Tax=Chiloscyllium punctatum TaxID=137246 RepID=A0A401SZ97_CHIPU|nr:hypothetical protein [Chiloscyllium punctatum]